MSKVKTKLVSLLVALSCVFACLGVGVFASKAINAKASDYTTYTITAVGANADSDSMIISVTSVGGDQLPVVEEENQDWENDYSFEEGSGTGLTLNGVSVAMDCAYLPTDYFYIILNDEAKDGDVFTIDGAFYNDTTAVKVVFVNCSLQFVDGVWETYGEIPSEPEVPEVTVYNVNKIGPANGCTTSVINAYVMTGDTLTVNSWDHAFVFVEGTGDGAMINGEAVTIEMKQPGADLYINLGRDAVAGDVLTLDGEFYSEAANAKIVFNKCALAYNGTSWETIVIYDSYNLGRVTGVVDGNYLTFDQGVTLPISSWDYAFNNVTGNGITIDGVSVSLINNIKSVGNKLYVAFDSYEVDSILLIEGTFRNDDNSIAYVIERSEFKWNGSAWVSTEEPITPPVVVEYTTHQIGALILHGNSNVGGASGSNDVLYLMKADESALPVEDWSKFFVAENAENFKVNGETATLTACKSTGDGFYWEFNALNAGDYITISGTFVCEDLAVKYVIEESHFQWTGERWNVYVPPVVVEYTEYTFTAVGAGGGTTASVVYLYPTAPEGAAMPSGDWDNVYAFVQGSGAGLKLNGEALATTDIKQPGDFFINLGVTADAGDVLTINGAYANETTAKKFIFVDCALEFNGTTWVEYVAPIEYTEYTFTAVGAGGGTTASVVYLYPTAPEGAAMPSGDWDNVYAFVQGSGAGLKLNGEALATTDIKQPGDFFINLGVTADAGDVLTINGAYANETTAKKFIFVDCALEFDGTTWVEYVAPIEYTVHQIGALILHGNSNVGGAKGDNSVLYLMREDGGELPVLDWSKIFVAENAENFKVNGETATLTACKSTGDGFYWEFNALNAGDYITISGTFVCEDLAVKYVIEESHFQWTGERWNVYAPSVAYTQVQLGKVTGIVDGNYLTFADGVTLPVSSWDYTFNDITGNGITINGVSVSLENNIKSVGNKLHVAFGVDDVDSILLIEGSFRNVDTLYEYVIERSEFRWTGSAWVTTEEIEYTTHDIGEVTVHAHSGKGAPSTASTALYMARVDGEALPVQLWENPFTLESGDGLKINGISVDLLEMQSTDAGLYIRLDGIVAGDVVSLSGTFACPTQGVKYVIAESKMVWNGSYWEVYAEYTDYEIGELRIISASSSADTVYMYRADGLALPLRDTDWVNKFEFRLGTGVGLTLNDNALPFGDIKSPNDFFIQLGASAVEGDVLKIGGTFYSATAAVAYIITESEFVYTDAGWRNKIDIVKDGLYADLDAYYAEFSADNYYEAEATLLVTTYEEGKAGIASAITIADAEQALVDAKAALDAIDTKEESDAKLPEKKESAKAELVAYKAQADYHDAQWAEIQAVISQANVAIDACTSTSEVIKAVADAKVLMDAVYTAEIYDAHKAVADDAKAELVAYKAQADYHDAEWTEIQAIIAQANEDIDKAFGDADAIAQVVVDAKAEIDLVETAVVVDARNLATAKENATNEVQAYYGAIDYTLYTDEAFGQIGALVDPALEAIANATSIEDVNAIVTAFKADVDAVEKIPAEKPASGCMSSIGGGIFAGLMPLMAIALARVLKKKED